MILTADRILTGDPKRVIPDTAVRINEGRIEAIGDPASLKERFPDDEVKCYPGASIMPGMIDLHVHFGLLLNPLDTIRPDTAALAAVFSASRMRETLRNGVLTVRDSCSGFGIGTALKTAKARGYIEAPRIFACLRGICMTGGHGSDALPDAVYECDSPDEVRKAIRKNLKNGADCIKILTSEGYRGEELSREELFAAAAEAHRLGVKIAAHAGYGASIENCIDAGVDSIEHGTHLTIEQGKKMVEKDITWVPTVLIFNYSYDQMLIDINSQGEAFANKPSVMRYLKEATECYPENIKPLYDMGVRIATGTDTDSSDYPECSPVAVECRYLVDCGLTPLEAIGCATKNGADYLGLGSCLGQIREGYIADVIVVEGDPSSDIDALTHVSAVFQEGRELIL